MKWRLGYTPRSALAGLWRLRVGDYRLVLDIQRDKLLIVAIDLGHRSTIYTD